MGIVYGVSETYCRLLQKGDSATYMSRHGVCEVTDSVVTITRTDVVVIRKHDVGGIGKKLYVGFDCAYYIFRKNSAVDSRIKLRLLGL
jgi:hypothetical protein